MGIYHSYYSLMTGSAQAITGIGTASATTFASTLPAGATGIRIVADGAIWYCVNGSASATRGTYLPANVIDYAPADSSAMITVIAVTTTGRSAWITPLSG